MHCRLYSRLIAEAHLACMLSAKREVDLEEVSEPGGWPGILQRFADAAAREAR